MELKQSQKLTQSLALTPLMKQSLQILQLPILDLKHYIEAQIEENPVLDYEPSAEDKQPTITEQIDRFAELQEHHPDNFSNAAGDTDDESQHYQHTLAISHPSLHEHLIKQLKTSPLDARRTALGELIIANIDESGYFNTSVEEILHCFNKIYTRNEAALTKHDIDKVLQLIQTFDPPGVAARNLQECLLIQLRLRNREHAIAYTLVKNHLSSLAKNQISQLAKKLRCSPQEILNAKKEITSLIPKPGTHFKSFTHQEVARPTPDVILQKHAQKYEILINMKNLPNLKINPYYLNLLKSKDTPEHIKKYVQERISKALGIIKALAQREETIRKIVEEIVTIQKDFFEQHDPALLKPLMLKDIAKKVNRNESTVSRVVNSKYIETSHGTYRLDHFFSNSMPTMEGENVSQEFIKSRIFHLIEEESPQKPLKDGQLVLLLQKEGLKIARRTVAKYRESLNIAPAHQRKRSS